MKQIFLLAVAISVLVISCMDVEENIQINKDNSGVYSYKIDMSKMMEIMAQMSSVSDLKEKVAKIMDSTINLKDLVDTSSTLSAEDKAALRDGVMLIHLNETDNEMVLTLDFPFKDFAQLNYIKKNALASLNKMKSLDKALGESGMSPKPGAEDNLAGGMNFNSFPGNDIINNTYSFNAQKNSLSNIRILKDESTDQTASDSSMMAMQMMSMMMGELNFKTTITLPAAAKKYSGNKATLSPDKKTITFSNTLGNLINKPESGEFSVEY